MRYEVKLAEIWEVVSELPPIIFARYVFPARFALTRNSSCLLKFSRFYEPGYSNGEVLNLWSTSATIHIWKANLLTATLPLGIKHLLDWMSPHSILNHKAWTRIIDRAKSNTTVV